MDVMWAKSQIRVTSMRFRCLLLLAASCLLRPPRPACSVVPLLRSGSWNRWRSSREGSDVETTQLVPQRVQERSLGLWTLLCLKRKKNSLR